MDTSVQFSQPASRGGSEEWPTLRLYQRERGKQFFSVADLVCLQSETNYTWLNWKDGERMLMPRTLKFYEPKLPTRFFFRLHRNCLVNARYISGFERDQTGVYVLLTTGLRLLISRRRWSAIKKMMDAYKEMN